MLKKLLKMNLAVLLAGSSASVLSTNNIIFAEESLQSENNSDVKQNELSEKTTGESSQASLKITKFAIDENYLNSDKIVLEWDFVAKNEGDVKVQLKIKKKNETDEAYLTLASSGKSYTSPFSDEPINSYRATDIVFKLTVTEGDESAEQTLEYVITGLPFSQHDFLINNEMPRYKPIEFDYTGKSIDFQISMAPATEDMYTLSYYKKNQEGYWEEVELPFIETGEYKVEVKPNELGIKYYKIGTITGLIKVNKIDQPDNETIIKDHNEYDIKVGDSSEYKLVQKSEVKGGAKVEYVSTNEDVVMVDENGNMTLLSVGNYEISSKILESANYKEKELTPIIGTITAGKLLLVSVSLSTKENATFNLAENVLFRTAAGKEIRANDLGNYNSVTYTVKENNLGVAEGETTSIKPAKAGKLTVTVEVSQTDQAKALYEALTQDIEINVEAISSGGSSSSLFTGWKSNGSYYEKSKPVSGIKEIKGVTYFFDEKGFPMKNQMIVIKEKTYITDGKGIFRKGKTEFEGATYVLDKTDGHMLRDWALVDGEWYFMSYETGKVHKNLWAPSASGDWYFMDAEGHMKKNQWIASSEGRWYYVGDEGKMLSNGSVDGCWINEQGIYLSPMYKG